MQGAKANSATRDNSRLGSSAARARDMCMSAAQGEQEFVPFHKEGLVPWLHFAGWSQLALILQLAGKDSIHKRDIKSHPNY